MRIFLSGSTSFLGSKFIEFYSNKYEIFGFAKHDLVNQIDILDFNILEKAFNNFNPDAIIHLAAVVDQDASKVMAPNIMGTENIVQLAKHANLPVILMSSESIYGGKEDIGGYKETDLIKPRSVYGETKAEQEKIVKESGLNYLILRAHRFVGINKKYNKPKQFPDHLKTLIAGEQIHLDNHKLFRPTLINHICQVFDYYLMHNMDKKIILNIGVDKATTYYDFMIDIARELRLDEELIKPDGEELNWPENSTLNLDKLKQSGYPTLSLKQLLNLIKLDYS